MGENPILGNKAGEKVYVLNRQTSEEMWALRMGRIIITISLRPASNRIVCGKPMELISKIFDGRNNDSSSWAMWKIEETFSSSSSAMVHTFL